MLTTKNREDKGRHIIQVKAKRAFVLGNVYVIIE